MSRYHYYPWGTIQVSPEDLIRFAWSEPMRDLAVKVGMSDAGVRKLLQRTGVVLPPQGYWNKIRSGKAVPALPAPPARRPGETGLWRIDRRFADIVPAAPSMPSSGPFATVHVPEDLEDLRSAQLKTMGKISVPRSLDAAHSGLRDLLAGETKRRTKFVVSNSNWDKPWFDNPFDQRRLRILNAIFLALEKRRHGGRVWEDNGELHARAMIGDSDVRIDINAADKPKSISRHGYRRDDPVIPVSTPVMLRFPEGDGPERTWKDDETGKLESKIATIAADLVVAGEAAFRSGLRREEVRLEEARIAREKQRRQLLEQRNRERLEALYKSGDMLRRAQEIRTLVAEVEKALTASAAPLDDALDEWRRWALSEANKLDPVYSGQFREHLHAPVLSDIPP